MSPLESKLRQLVASLDSSALEALANKGLLRRAQKDLERGVETKILGETGNTLRLKIAEFEVSLPDSGPATAKCSCPAAGVCQHILTAVLFLQKATAETASEAPASTAGAEAQTSANQELMAITAEQLEQWAGKATFKAGMKLAAQFNPEVVRERSIRIRFPSMNSEVRFVPGGGLDGIIVSGGKGDGRPLIVAAIIGFQRAEGKDWQIPADVSALEASEGAPRTRAEVLESCQLLLDETLRNGLSRISSSSRERWSTLAVSALGVNLPRLALALRGVGDETALVVARDARSDLGRTLGRMAQLHALCSALQNGGESPRGDLVGMHRTRYDEIGNLDLVGAAAWPWRTASGYEGLTVLFWDPLGKSWNSWSESRPRHQLADFRPVARYTQPGPWEGAESPRQLASSSFRLMNARRNPGHRLSSSGKSRVLVTGPAKLATQNLPIINDWTQLIQQSNAQTGVGLKEANPLDSIVALKPTTWADRGFNPVTQIFVWLVVDSQNRPLPLEIAFDDFTEPAIKFLENVAPESLEGALIVGRVQRSTQGLSLHPLSIHKNNGEVVNLCLDNAKGAPSNAIAPNIDEEESVGEEEEESESTPIFSPALSRLLNETDDGLLALAESGLAACNPMRLERLKQIASRAERLGLSAIANGLGNVATQPAPSSVLRGAYLSELHKRALSLSE
jgi:hypothetical protein